MRHGKPLAQHKRQKRRQGAGGKDRRKILSMGGSEKARTTERQRKKD